MKKIFLFPVMLLLAATVFSQTKPKPKEKPPTQKEMTEMMKEMQAAMDGMSEEDKKIMDSMGIKMPSMKDLPKFSDKQITEALENESRIIPKKDVARIAAIPKAVSDAKLGAYIVAIQNKLALVFKPVVISAGNKVYEYIKSNSKTSGEAANMAMALWLKAKPELALYVLGKICAMDAGNTDNLSNYAAMLSMQGAQHLAIPILNNLNARYPKNSTLLNNLGQAWFGLGEIGKAEKYLDSAIRIYAYHPQANMTKSLIEESKGNKQQAVEAVKRSIAKAFSSEKETRLNKLGYKLKTGDVGWNRRMPQDPLGLEKFKWPEYPMNLEESEKLEAEWDAFKQTCQAEISTLEPLMKSLEKEAEQSNELRTKQLMQASQRRMMFDPLPRFAYKAMAKLNYLVDDKDGHISFSYQKKLETISNSQVEETKFNDRLSNQLKVLDEKYKDQFGEGKPNPFDAACADDTKAKNSYLSSSNSLMRDAFNDFLGFMRRKINNEVYYYQYTMWPENFELAKVLAKISWLNLIKSQYPKFKDKSIWCNASQDEENNKPFKLAKFDDVACQYNDTLDLMIVAFYNNCSRMTSKLNLKFVEYTRYDDFERAEGDTYISSSLKISVEQGFDKLKFEKGPLKLEGKVGASVELEMDREGIKDIILGVEAKAGAGVNLADEELEKSGSIAGKDVIDTTIEVGVEGRVSLISGHGGVSGTGKLEGIKLIEW
ncbi:MAG TPA: hypothetical protein VF476_14900 [Chitinophagaceae bacterium]